MSAPKNYRDCTAVKINMDFTTSKKKRQWGRKTHPATLEGGHNEREANSPTSPFRSMQARLHSPACGGAPEESTVDEFRRNPRTSGGTGSSGDREGGYGRGRPSLESNSDGFRPRPAGRGAPPQQFQRHLAPQNSRGRGYYRGRGGAPYLAGRDQQNSGGASGWVSSSRQPNHQMEMPRYYRGGGRRGVGLHAHRPHHLSEAYHESNGRGSGTRGSEVAADPDAPVLHSVAEQHEFPVMAPDRVMASVAADEYGFACSQQMLHSTSPYFTPAIPPPQQPMLWAPTTAGHHPGGQYAYYPALYPESSPLQCDAPEFYPSCEAIPPPAAESSMPRASLTEGGPSVVVAAAAAASGCREVTASGPLKLISSSVANTPAAAAAAAPLLPAEPLDHRLTAAEELPQAGTPIAGQESGGGAAISPSAAESRQGAVVFAPTILSTFRYGGECALSPPPATTATAISAESTEESLSAASSSTAPSTAVVCPEFSPLAPRDSAAELDLPPTAATEQQTDRDSIEGLQMFQLCRNTENLAASSVFPIGDCGHNTDVAWAPAVTTEWRQNNDTVVAGQQMPRDSCYKDGLLNAEASDDQLLRNSFSQYDSISFASLETKPSMTSDELSGMKRQSIKKCWMDSLAEDEIANTDGHNSADTGTIEATTAAAAAAEDDAGATIQEARRLALQGNESWYGLTRCLFACYWELRSTIELAAPSTAPDGTTAGGGVLTAPAVHDRMMTMAAIDGRVASLMRFADEAHCNATGGCHVGGGMPRMSSAEVTELFLRHEADLRCFPELCPTISGVMTMQQEQQRGTHSLAAATTAGGVAAMKLATASTATSSIFSPADAAWTE